MDDDTHVFHIRIDVLFLKTIIFINQKIKTNEKSENKKWFTS
jgi:hypothetical protein